MRPRSSPAAQEPEVAEIPLEVFRNTVNKQILKLVRPPTRKELGTKLVKGKPFATTESVIQEQVAIAAGLPEEDEQSGLLRLQPGGPVKPKKVSATRTFYKMKFQDPAHVKAFCRMEERCPTRGSGAAKLVLASGKEKRGLE